MEKQWKHSLTSPTIDLEVTLSFVICKVVTDTTDLQTVKVDSSSRTLQFAPEMLSMDQLIWGKRGLIHSFTITSAINFVMSVGTGNDRREQGNGSPHRAPPA